jgi:hypothetical protein
MGQAAARKKNSGGLCYRSWSGGVRKKGDVTDIPLEVDRAGANKIVASGIENNRAYPHLSPAI